MEKQVNRASSLKLFSIAVTLAVSLFYTNTLSNALAQDTTPTDNSKLREAQTYLEKGWALKAIEAFQKILRQEPDNLDATLGLAMAEEKQGRLERAIAPYEAALKLDPKEITALTRLGYLYSLKKDTWPLAIDRLSEALTLKPNDQASRRLLGDIYAWNGRFAEAEKNYLMLLANGVEDTLLQLSLAQVMTWQERGTEALPLFAKARLKVKLDETSRYAEALATFQAKKYDEAEKAYLALINDFPTKSKLYREDLEKLKIAQADLARQELEDILTDARSNFKKGNYPEAFAGFEKVLAARDDIQVRLEYSDLLSSQPESREKALAELALIEPVTKEIEIKRANLLTIIPEKREEAFNLLIKLHGQYTEDLEIEQQLTNLLSWIEYNDIKALFASELLAHSPSATGLRPPLIRYYMKTERFAQAIPLLEAEIKENDTSVANRLYLADASAELGRPFDERINLEAVLRLDPNNAQANERLGWITLEEDRKPEKALKKFKIASQANSTAKSPRLGQANALLALNRPLEAEDRLREIGISTDAAVDDANLRVQKSLAALNVDKSLRVSVTNSIRSGSEANDVSTRSKRVNPLSTSFIQYEASTRINSNIGLDLKAKAVNLDANQLGNVSGVEGEILVKLLPRDSIQLSLGAGATVTGRPTFITRIDLQSGIRKRLYIQASHTPLTESFLSYVGIPDKETNRTVGRVMATSIGGGISLPVGKDMDFSFSTKFDRLTGKALPSNLRREFQFNLSRELKNDTALLNRFDYFRPSINILYFDFEKDLNTIKLTPTGIGEPLLLRGYFSPSSFSAPGVRLDFGLHALNERLNIVGGLGVAPQFSRGNRSQFFTPGTEIGFNTSVVGRYNFTDRFIGTLSYNFSNTGSVFRESRISLGLSINLEQIIEKPKQKLVKTEAEPVINKVVQANPTNTANIKTVSPANQNSLVAEAKTTEVKASLPTKENKPVEKVEKASVNSVNIDVTSKSLETKTVAYSVSGYTVQVGASKSEEEAKRLSEELKENGFPTGIVQVDLGGKGILYRVRVGKYQTSREAKAIAQDLTANGYDGVVTVY